MSTPTGTDAYALGSNAAEHERLIRQAALLAPCTERVFRDSGIGPGNRVLELGSGVGDVAMLVARLVGPTGEVVGVERDEPSIATARARVTAAGLRNVSFIRSDVRELTGEKPFDAVVGRFILEFIPDPVHALRVVSQLVRPGGIVAFQEPSYIPFLALSSRLTLWSSVASMIHETIRGAGADTEIGLALHSVYMDAGLPAPDMRMELLMSSDPEFTRWPADLLCSLRRHIPDHDPSLAAIGDLATLRQRMHSEVVAANTAVPFVAMVGAWSRRPVGIAPG